jgi:phosphatidylglycerophosphatase C
MKSTVPPKPVVAVFDFDETLIDTDVAYQFLNAFIKRSKMRRIAFGLLMPILLPFLLNPKSRSVAMSVILWCATFPLHGKTGADLFRAFAPRFWRAPISGRFYNEGLDALAAHRRLGHRVLIITGSPRQLVKAVLEKKLNPPVEVFGSQVVPFLGGLVYRQYCMRDGKIRLARENGVLNEGWDFGYTDSAHDIPLLSHCRHRFLVNPSPRTTRRVKKALPERVTVLNWSDTSPIATKGKP